MTRPARALAECPVATQLLKVASALDYGAVSADLGREGR